MGTYYIAQGTLLSALWWSKQKENLKGGDICIHIVDFFCCAGEANTTLQNNYVAIKMN